MTTRRGGFGSVGRVVDLDLLSANEAVGAAPHPDPAYRLLTVAGRIARAARTTSRWPSSRRRPTWNAPAWTRPTYAEL